MTATLTKTKAQEQANDALSDARRRGRRIQVRRVAAIHLEGAHFKLRPLRASRRTAEA
jgi:hypothetical protein